ncbi:hypothetical protein A4A49_58200, partial [Nicotiana attenuata]
IFVLLTFMIFTFASLELTTGQCWLFVHKNWGSCTSDDDCEVHCNKYHDRAAYVKGQCEVQMHVCSCQACSY